MKEFGQALLEKLRREPVAVRSAVVAVVTAVAAVAGLNVEDPSFQWIIGIVTAALNGWLIKTARGKVTPLESPNLDTE